MIEDDVAIAARSGSWHVVSESFRGWRPQCVAHEQCCWGLAASVNVDTIPHWFVRCTYNVGVRLLYGSHALVVVVGAMLICTVGATKGLAPASARPGGWRGGRRGSMPWRRH